MRSLFGTVAPVQHVPKTLGYMKDRGLVAAAVRAYAKSQGITYEDAHQILRAGDGVPKVTQMSPDKWRLSRMDDEYRRKRMAACHETHKKILSKFGA